MKNTKIKPEERRCLRSELSALFSFISDGRITKNHLFCISAVVVAWLIEIADLGLLRGTIVILTAIPLAVTVVWLFVRHDLQKRRPLTKAPFIGWQPIETVPLDGTVIDLLHKDGGRLTDEWWTDDNCFTCLLGMDDFTHWILIPPVSC